MDSLGDRIKVYEALTSQKIPDGAPILLRLDGKSFHNWTSQFGLCKPFDQDMMTAMEHATASLSRDVMNFLCAYIQSDEATIVMYPTNPHAEQWFGGKVQKIASVGASLYTAYFNQWFREWEIPASFDCRAFSVPSLSEIANVLLWRQRDARRNAIEAVYHYHFGHAAALGKSTGQKVQEITAFIEEKEIQPMELQEISEPGVWMGRNRLTFRLPESVTHTDIFDMLYADIQQIKAQTHAGATMQQR